MGKINCDYIIESIDYALLDDIVFSLTAPLDQRHGFKFASTSVTIPRVVYRLIGIKGTQTEYYKQIGEIDSKLSHLGDLYLKVVGGLNRDYDIISKIKIKEIIENAYANGELDTYELANLLDERNLFPVFKNNSITNQLKHNFRGVLEYYRINSINTKEEFIDIIIGLVHFINAYLPNLFLNCDFLTINPKIIYYGEIETDEALFLLIAGSLGSDVLYLNTKNDGGFEKIDKFKAFSKEIVREFRAELKDNPFSNVYKAVTEASKASDEIEEQLFNGETGMFKPWQLSQFEVKVTSLKTTYGELLALAKEKANVRPGFEFKNGVVKIPNIFAKVAGVHKNTNEYFRELNDLLDLPKRAFISKLPYLSSVHLEYGKLEQIYSERGYAYFDTEKLINASWWPYKDLRTGLQQNIANTIKELCLHPIIKNVEKTGIRDVQVDVLSVGLKMDEKLCQLLQAFDYPETIPKIIIYNNEKNGALSYEDAILLSILNKLGVDIIIFNPSGYNDLENFYKEGIVDIHNLENIKFGLDFSVVKKEKPAGFFKKIFSKE